MKKNGSGKRESNESHDHMDQTSFLKKKNFFPGRNSVKTWKKLDFFYGHFIVRCNWPSARYRFEDIHFV